MCPALIKWIKSSYNNNNNKKSIFSLRKSTFFRLCLLILFVDALDVLKSNLNLVFKEPHPTLPLSLSLGQFHQPENTKRSGNYTSPLSTWKSGVIWAVQNNNNKGMVFSIQLSLAGTQWYCVIPNTLSVPCTNPCVQSANAAFGVKVVIQFHQQNCIQLYSAHT